MSDSSFKIAAVAAPVRQQVVEALRRAILGGRFRPGERLVERELCELTAVSRTSIREALRHLEVEGFVQVVPHKGMIVAIRDDGELRQIADLLASLRDILSQYFDDHADARQRADLRRCYQQFRTDLGHGDVGRIAGSGEALYQCLLQGTGNEPLGEMMTMLRYRAALATPWPARAELDVFADIAAIAADILERRPAVARVPATPSERSGLPVERRAQAGA